MAIFGDVTTIRTFIDPFTCVSPCVMPYGIDKIVLSESKHLAVLYDLNTCLPIKCWTFSELDPLVSPFVYDHVNEKFVAVKQLKLALFKCDSEDNLIQFKLGKFVHCLIGNPTGESLVLFKNGSVQPLGWVIADRGKTIEPGVIPASEEILKTIINQFSPEITRIALLTKTQNCFNKLYMLKVDLANGTGELDAKYTVKQNYKCLSMNKNGHPIGLTENGRIELLQVEGEQQLINLHDSSVISALCLPEEDTLAVVVQKNQSYILKIINLKYKVITSQLPLDIVPLPGFISQSNGNIFIAGRKAMLCVPYEIKSASLATVMGKNLLSKDHKTSLKRKTASSPDHIFHDSSSDIKLTSSSLNDRITFDELKQLLPKSDELLSEKSIFSAFATILKSKCLALSGDMFKEIFDSIISRPFNHSYMVDVVKSTKLTVEQSINIIDFLIDSLSLDNGCIVDWLIVVLDACLKLILFSRIHLIRKTLKKLEKKLQLMDKSLGKCLKISNQIDDLLTSNPKLWTIRVYNGVKHEKYCIEFLEL